MSLEPRAFVKILVAFTLGACGAGGSLAECVGGFSGTYEGDATGWVTATMGFDGAAEITFGDEGGGEIGIDKVMVSEEGNFRRSLPASLRVEGKFDFETCTATGAWSLPNAMGSFNLEDV